MLVRTVLILIVQSAAESFQGKERSFALWPQCTCWQAPAECVGFLWVQLLSHPKFPSCGCSFFSILALQCNSRQQHLVGSSFSEVFLKQFGRRASNEHLPVNNFLESSRGWNSSQLLHRSPQDLSAFQ